MNPGIAGGAEREVRCAVRVAEVMSMPDRDRAVISWLRRGADESSGLAIQCSHIAGCGVSPFTWGVGHKTNFVNSIAVVEAIYSDRALFQRKRGLHVNVDKRIASGRSLKRRLEDVVLADGVAGGVGNGVSGSEHTQNARRGEFQHVTTIHDGESLASRSRTLPRRSRCTHEKRPHDCGLVSKLLDRLFRGGFDLFPLGV